jgi:hypothetical protein
LVQVLLFSAVVFALPSFVEAEKIAAKAQAGVYICDGDRGVVDIKEKRVCFLLPPGRLCLVGNKSIRGCANLDHKNRRP